MTYEHDRDAALERLLRRTGGPGRALSTTDRCLDAETLAAWVDGDLTPAARRAAEAHGSQCARCQSIVAVMMQTADVEGDSQTAHARTFVGYRRSLRWLVPLTGGALAATLWLVVRPDTRPPAEPAVISVLRDRAADAPAPAPAAASKPAEDERGAAAGDADKFRQRASAPTAARPASAEAQSAGRAREELAKAEADAARDAAPKPQPGLGSVSKTVPPMPGASVPVPTPSPVQVSAAPVAPPAPAEARAHRVDNLSERRAVLGRVAAESTVAPLLIASPEPSSRWRITAGRSVEHSADGGTTWTAQAVPSDLVLLAGAAPSASVCWIVGRAGAVLLTTDARTWQRLPFPERLDLTAIHATDGRSATVQTADGNTFQTADGGQTWSRR